VRVCCAVVSLTTVEISQYSSLQQIAIVYVLRCFVTGSWNPYALHAAINLPNATDNGQALGYVDK
jgi:hypothetical protein